MLGFEFDLYSLAHGQPIPVATAGSSATSSPVPWVVGLVIGIVIGAMVIMIVWIGQVIVCRKIRNHSKLFSKARYVQCMHAPQLKPFIEYNNFILHAECTKKLETLCTHIPFSRQPHQQLLSLSLTIQSSLTQKYHLSPYTQTVIRTIFTL